MIISIITVCFNSVKTIEQTVQSVLAQDYPQIEYIIVDGGSHDGTQAIIERYQHRLAAFISEKDQGIYHAMNKGISRARGDIIGFLNSDDLYASSKVISTVVAVFQKAKVQACYGDLLYFSDREPTKVVRYWQAGNFIPGAFAKGWNPPHPTFFTRRKNYLQWGGFDTTYSMGNDIELMMRFLEKHKLVVEYVPELWVKMRLGGISNSGIKNIILQNKSIIQAAKNLNIKISLWKFIFGKMINRLSQFISLRSGYQHGT